MGKSLQKNHYHSVIDLFFDVFSKDSIFKEILKFLVLPCYKQFYSYITINL